MFRVFLPWSECRVMKSVCVRVCVYCKGFKNTVVKPKHKSLPAVHLCPCVRMCLCMHVCCRPSGPEQWGPAETSGLPQQCDHHHSLHHHNPQPVYQHLWNAAHRILPMAHDAHSLTRAQNLCFVTFWLHIWHFNSAPSHDDCMFLRHRNKVTFI